MALSLFGRDPFLSDVNTFGSMGHLDRQMQQMQRRAAAGMRPLAVDITENDRGFTIAADLPGYNKDDVHLTVHDGVLAITAERKVAEETKTDKEWHRERFHGKVQRSVQLPESADEHAVSADFEHQQRAKLPACAPGLTKLWLVFTDCSQSPKLGRSP